MYAFRLLFKCCLMKFDTTWRTLQPTEDYGEPCSLRRLLHRRHPLILIVRERERDMGALAHWGVMCVSAPNCACVCMCALTVRV